MLPGVEGTGIKQPNEPNIEEADAEQEGVNAISSEISRSEPDTEAPSANSDPGKSDWFCLGYKQIVFFLIGRNASRC